MPVAFCALFGARLAQKFGLTAQGSQLMDVAIKHFAKH